MAGSAIPSGAARPPPFPAPDPPRERQSGEAQLTRILIVEDEFLVAREVESSLSEAGFEVVGIATAAAEAVQLAATTRPALIVMDVRLRGARDGVEAAVDIFAALGIRCIFTSAYSESAMRERAQRAAPLGWLVKPYAIDTLIAMVRAAVKPPPP